MTSLNKNTSLQVVNTGLTQREREVIKELPLSLQEYVRAKDSPKIFEMAPADAETKIYDLIVTAQINRGHTKAVNDLEINLANAAAILKLIYKKYRVLTVAELELCFFNGCSGEYGETVGVNLESASVWLKGYDGAELKKKAIHEWNKKLDADEVVEKTPEQKNIDSLKSCVNYFDDFRKGSVVNYFTDLLSATYYDILLNNRLINFDKEKRLEIYATAQSEIKKGLKKQSSFVAALGEENKLNIVCKRIALHEYFRELIKNGSELSDLIKNINK